MLKPTLAVLIPCLLLLPTAIDCQTSPAPNAGGSAHFAQGLDQMLNKGAFWGKQVQLAWEDGGDSYTILEPAADGKAVEIVAYETASGKRSVRVSAAELTPAGARREGDPPLAATPLPVSATVDGRCTVSLLGIVRLAVGYEPRSVGVKVTCRVALPPAGIG